MKPARWTPAMQAAFDEWIDARLAREAVACWEAQERELGDELRALIDRMLDSDIPMALAHLLIRRHLARLVPADITWEFCTDSRGNLRVSYSAPQGRSGVVADWDYTIVCGLLAAVDWGEVRKPELPRVEPTRSCAALDFSEVVTDPFELARRAAILRSRGADAEWSDTSRTGEAIAPTPTPEGRGAKAQPVAVEVVRLNEARRAGALIT